MRNRQEIRGQYYRFLFQKQLELEWSFFLIVGVAYPWRICVAFTLILALSGCPKQSSFVGAYDLKRGDTLAGYTALTLSFNGGHMVMFMGREGSAPVSAEGSYTDDAASVSVSFDSGQPFGVAGSNWKFLKRGDTLVSDSPGISATLELQK